MDIPSRRRGASVDPRVQYVTPRGESYAESYPPYPTTAYAQYQPVARSDPPMVNSARYPPCLISEPRAYKGEPESYILAPQDVSPYERRRRDVLWDNYLAPPPLPRPTRQRYPKEYQNEGMQFDPQNGKIYEYPDEPYVYGDAQNGNGHRKIFGPNGRQIKALPPGPSRAITDIDKTLQGVVYHPRKKSGFHKRAAEKYPDGKVYEFDNNLHYRRVQ